jgi:hypothetical protein
MKVKMKKEEDSDVVHSLVLNSSSDSESLALNNSSHNPKPTITLSKNCGSIHKRCALTSVLNPDAPRSSAHLQQHQVELDFGALPNGEGSSHIGLITHMAI